MVSHCVSRGIVYNNYFISVYSDMKKVYMIFVIVVLLLMLHSSGVNGNYDLWAEEITDKELFVKVPDDEWPTQVIFDTTNICYSGIIRWIIMGQPSLAGQIPPPHVIRTMTVHCFCVMDKLRTQYKFTSYTNMLNKENPLKPKLLPELFKTKSLECIKEHKTLSGLIILNKDMFDNKINQKDNETKIDQKIEVKPPDNNSGKSDSTPEQPKELPEGDAPLLNF